MKSYKHVISQDQIFLPSSQTFSCPNLQQVPREQNTHTISNKFVLYWKVQQNLLNQETDVTDLISLHTQNTVLYYVCSEAY